MPAHRPVCGKRTDDRPDPGQLDRGQHQDPPPARDRFRELCPRQRVPEPDHAIGTTRYHAGTAIGQLSNRERSDRTRMRCHGIPGGLAGQRIPPAQAAFGRVHDSQRPIWAGDYHQRRTPGAGQRGAVLYRRANRLTSEVVPAPQLGQGPSHHDAVTGY
jgi:hypothetical protein